MSIHRPVRSSLTAVIAWTVLLLAGGAGRAAEGAEGAKRYLYVVVPGIRNLLEFGGAGILVFDIDNDHRFVKRIETTASMEKKPHNIKGVCAHAGTPGTAGRGAIRFSQLIWASASRR